jgi:hypothetical protein
MSPEERRARQLVGARIGATIDSPGACEGCDRRHASDWAHRWARSGGGLWCPSNGLALCRVCHKWQHAHPIDAQVAGWTIVPEGGEAPVPAEVPVLTAYRGWVRLLPDGSIVQLKIRPTTGRRRRSMSRRPDLARRDLARPA